MAINKEIFTKYPENLSQIQEVIKLVLIQSELDTVNAKLGIIIIPNSLFVRTLKISQDEFKRYISIINEFIARGSIEILNSPENTVIPDNVKHHESIIFGTEEERNHATWYFSKAREFGISQFNYFNSVVIYLKGVKLVKIKSIRDFINNKGYEFKGDSVNKGNKIQFHLSRKGILSTSYSGEKIDYAFSKGMKLNLIRYLAEFKEIEDTSHFASVNNVKPSYIRKEIGELKKLIAFQFGIHKEKMFPVMKRGYCLGPDIDIIKKA